MHDAHDHDGLGEHEHLPKWVVYLATLDDTGYWTCSVVEAHSDIGAVERMVQVMPVGSPFKAWAFPIEESEGMLLTATVQLTEVTE